MAKPRLLWCGDSPTVPTGFARVTENILTRLRPAGWAIGVLAVNYEGDPHSFPFSIYPAHLGGDIWGVGRFGDLVKNTQPDVVLVLNDSWIVAQFAEVKVDVPVVAYMPVDAPHQPAEAIKSLNKLVCAVFYTQFGLDEARASGYEGPAEIIPHGVNSELYRPMDREEVRAGLNMSNPLLPGAFVIGNVNRNQWRKRLDLTLMHFAHWVEEKDIPENVYLLLHCARRDVGWDVVGLARYLGIHKRLILTNSAETSRTGVTEAEMPRIYNAIDLQISTTLGEGWGLTTHEGMACGIPQLVPEWSALAEWPRGAVRYAPVSSHLAADNMVTTLGGVVDADAFIAEMDHLYRDPDLRAEYGRLARERATEERFSWDNIAARFDTLLQGLRKEPAIEEPTNAVAV